MVDLSGLSSEIVLVLYVLTIILIGVNFLLAFVMLQKYTKIELEFTKKYFRGLILFLFVHAVCRIFYLLHDFYFPTEQIWWEIGALLGLLSITLLIMAVESTIFKQTRHILTIIGVVGLILMTIQIILIATDNELTVNLSQIVQYAVVSTLGLFMLFIYIYVAIKSTGNIRSSAVLMAIGILIFELGQIAHTSAAIALLGNIAIILAPILMTAALILLYVAISQFYTE